jgi:hypothetical protein
LIGVLLKSKESITAVLIYTFIIAIAIIVIFNAINDDSAVKWI